MRLPISLAVSNAGGDHPDWDDGSPTLHEEAFARYALRFRAVMRMDVAVLRPNLLTTLTAIEP